MFLVGYYLCLGPVIVSSLHVLLLLHTDKKKPPLPEGGLVGRRVGELLELLGTREVKVSFDCCIFV